MGRVFKRGELKRTILAAIGELGEVHGYVLMHALRDRVGGGWKPSAGSIYPALLSLESAGLITSRMQDGVKSYSLTQSGSEALGGSPGTAWTSLASRSAASPVRETLQTHLHRLVDASPAGRRLVSPDRVASVEEVFRRAEDEIVAMLERNEEDG